MEDTEKILEKLRQDAEDLVVDYDEYAKLFIGTIKESFPNNEIGYTVTGHELSITFDGKPTDLNKNIMKNSKALIVAHGFTLEGVIAEMAGIFVKELVLQFGEL